jgi:hypothetical protein
MSKVLSWIDGFFDRIFCILFAILFLQIPHFIHEYILVLKGHIDELKHYTKLIHDAASHSDKSIEQYIHKFLQSSDHDFVRQGEVMQKMNTRLHDMTTAFNALQEASLWKKPFVLIANWQSDIGHATWSLFQFGLPLTLESIVYALAGVVVGFCVYHGITSMFRGGKKVVSSQ